MSRHPFRTLVLTLLYALALLLPVFSVNAGALSEIFKPKIIKLGSPEVLFHADAERIRKLFPVGTTRERIHAKFGLPPADYGSTTERDVYGYSISYSKFNVNQSSFTVMRAVSAYIDYDAKGKVKSVESTIFANYVATAKSVVVENREPTPLEVGQYLMQVEPSLADQVIAQGFTDASLSQPKTALTAKPWHLGIHIATESKPSAWSLSGARIRTLITGFENNAIGQAGGLMVGDEVLTVNGEAVQHAVDLSVKIGNANPTQPLMLGIQRGRATQTFVFQPAR